MASKKYISVIRLFEHCGIPTGQDFNLARAKKQLMAEFGIAADGFIEVDGHTYTRHDVLEEINRPDFQQRLVFHKQIWGSPEILLLLEENSINLHTIKIEFKPFWGNSEFIEFFSPYFAEPFSYLSRTLLGEANFGELGNLLLYGDFLLASDREEAFRPLRIFLDENMRLLRNVNKENYDIMREKISHWIDREWYHLFNSLPHEFYDIRSDIIAKLINITVAIQKTNKKDCKLVSGQLILLEDVPESLRNIIVSNHHVYTGSSKSTGVKWGPVFWVGWIIIMLIRTASSDGCGNNSNSYQNFRPTYQLPDSLLRYLQKKDSTLHLTDDTVFKIVPSSPYKRP